MPKIKVTYSKGCSHMTGKQNKNGSVMLQPLETSLREVAVTFVSFQPSPLRM